ncbi:hypothetical protein HK098_000858 [Nowakowskiella sp. JEL0407]|nr:hypothetical protein HK098_000858 [Nowakowskiella sp. JEL0407]
MNELTDELRPQPSVYDEIINSLSSKSNYEPISYSVFFNEKFMVKIPAKNAEPTDNAVEEDQFTVYRTKFRKSDAAIEVPTAVFVLHHGAGYCSLTWSVMSKVIESVECEDPYDILCYDCRGHGSTTTSNDSDLSIGTLSDDLVAVVNQVYPNLPSQIVLVGHSMGGSIVVDVAANRKFGRNVLGVVVIDVVEGTAMDSLKHMRSLLHGRPRGFKSLEDAIKWSVTSRTSHNVISSRVSVPGQLIKVESSTGVEFVWRTNLLKSERYWEGWFTDLSTKFLAAPTARLLVLAGTDRLDKPLTIGQMQGKFQMIVVPESGHAIQEDMPEKIGKILVEFWKRNQPLKFIKRFPIPERKMSSKSSFERQNNDAHGENEVLPEQSNQHPNAKMGFSVNAVPNQFFIPTAAFPSTGPSQPILGNADLLQNLINVLSAGNPSVAGTIQNNILQAALQSTVLPVSTEAGIPHNPLLSFMAPFSQNLNLVHPFSGKFPSAQDTFVMSNGTTHTPSNSAIPNNSRREELMRSSQEKLASKRRLNDSIKHLEKEVNELEADLEKDSAEYRKQDRKAQRVRDEISDIQKKIDELEKSLKISVDTKADYEKSKKILTSRMDNQRSKIDSLKKKILSYKSELNDLELELIANGRSLENEVDNFLSNIKSGPQADSVVEVHERATTKDSAPRRSVSPARVQVKERKPPVKTPSSSSIVIKERSPSKLSSDRDRDEIAVKARDKRDRDDRESRERNVERDYDYREYGDPKRTRYGPVFNGGSHSPGVESSNPFRNHFRDFWSRLKSRGIARRDFENAAVVRTFTLITKDVCLSYNRSKCNEKCGKLHVCLYCFGPHVFVDCPMERLNCVRFNVDENSCKNPNCFQDHRCLRCGSVEHTVSRCNVPPPNTSVQFCYLWNANHGSRKEQNLIGCLSRNCGRNHRCMRCGDSSHPVVICPVNLECYLLVEKINIEDRFAYFFAHALPLESYNKERDLRSERSARNEPDDFRSLNPRAISCYDWNKGKCSRFECRHEHICSKCGSPNHNAMMCIPYVPERNPSTEVEIIERNSLSAPPPQANVENSNPPVSTTTSSTSMANLKELENVLRKLSSNDSSSSTNNGTESDRIGGMIGAPSTFQTEYSFSRTFVPKSKSDLESKDAMDLSGTEEPPKTSSWTIRSDED